MLDEILDELKCMLTNLFGPRRGKLKKLFKLSQMQVDGSSRAYDVWVCELIIANKVETVFLVRGEVIYYEIDLTAIKNFRIYPYIRSNRIMIFAREMDGDQTIINVRRKNGTWA